MPSIFDSPRNSENDPFSNSYKSRHVSPLKSSSPSKRLIFSSRSPNISRTQSYLSKPTFSSPTKLNVVTSDWNDKAAPVDSSSNSFPVLKNRLNSSSSTYNYTSQKPSSSSGPPSPSRRALKRASTTDRFIPSRHSTSGKLFCEEINPKPTDSPTKHIEFQSTKIYQHSVAQVCGVNLNQKILQFQPAPPERKRTIDLHSQFSSTLNDGLSSVLANSRMYNNGINPSTAIARARKIPSIPERILDAPGLVDDYYLNLLSWSVTNLLAVALENSVYIWQASVGAVNLLTNCDSLITSLSWSDDGSYLSIGKENGTIEVWDIEDNVRLRTMKTTDSRVACHAWSNHLVTNGSRSGEIYHHDVRVAKHVVGEMKNHTAEVCGIQWRPDGNQLASGGNDNIVNIWDARSSIPQFTKTTHTAAVKAVSWCDYQSSLLSTGGGSSDKCIHFWNTTTGARVNSINTGSQITSLKWGLANGTGKEIVATSGYPNNSISVYSYPTLQKTGEIVKSHDARILYSALSPDGMTLATAAGDENLKFWKIFDVPSNRASDEESSLTNGGKQIRKVMTIR